MSEPFIGQIKIFGFIFAPENWANCNGALLPINQNQALYAIIGTTFGGDGTTTFALPELRGRMALGHDLSNAKPYATPLGRIAGQETVTLTTAQMPTHTHSVQASSDDASEILPTDNVFATTNKTIYAQFNPNNLVNLNTNAVSSAGGGQAHENRMPSLAVNFCISLDGIFPPRN